MILLGAFGVLYIHQEQWQYIGKSPKNGIEIEIAYDMVCGGYVEKME